MKARAAVGVAEGSGLKSNDPASTLERARAAQQAWGATRIEERLQILKRFRHALAESCEDIAASVPCEQPGSLHRTIADTLVSEVLPLAEACRFLEREASSILAPQRPGKENRPFWLRGVTTEIRREPLGVVLIIGPSNYPLFLPGVQALQALAGGNAVLWKPAPGGSSAAGACRLLLVAAGLDPSLLPVLDEAPDAATAAIRGGVDKVFLTGSESTGRAVLRELAETLTPSVVELSGCDAVFVLEGADLDRVVAALTFGLRLNGSATCMAPRRVFVTAKVANDLVGRLAVAVESIGPVIVPSATKERLLDLMADAEAKGARFLKNGLHGVPGDATGAIEIRPTLVVAATAEMRITQADIFAPVLSMIEVASEEEALAANRRCPYTLTAAVFGSRSRAERLASQIPAGTVLINDIIVATADPRAPFGGRKHSGYGTTRGREGLLEMTVIKTVQIQNARDVRAYAPHTPHHRGFFSGYIQAVHSAGWRQRWSGLREFLNAMINLR
jgi:acyl-CoA reductase-like NAD-dependent aldehyde dehydrogenase